MNNINQAWAIDLNYTEGLAGKYFFFNRLDLYNDRPRTQLFATRKDCIKAIKEKSVDGKPVKVRIRIEKI